MSFPHRTAFYDREEDEIWSVKRSAKNELAVSAHSIVKDTIYGNERGRFIPLASSGLDDSEGNEVFEGHIVQGEPPHSSDPAVVFFQDGMFRIDWGTGEDVINVVSTEKCIGHALTDPDLVPDSFDVEEYFDGN